MSFSSMPQWFNQAMVSLHQHRLRHSWFWLEFKEILGSLSFPMLFILCLYIRYLVIAMLSMREKPHFYEENRISRIAFNSEFISYKSLLDLLNIPPRFSRNVAPPYFTAIQDNNDDKKFKEELLFIPHDKIGWFTVILKTKISFPPSINTFLNAIVPIEFVMNINSKILVRSHFKSNLHKCLF